jgi:hypothetical protein
MKVRFDKRISLVLAALLFVPVSILAEDHTPTAPLEGAKKVQDSERFLIWDATWQKGKSSGMRKLNMDEVSVTVTEGAIKITKPDGSWSIEEQRAGSVRYEPRGTMIEEEGVSDTPCHQAIFQLKDLVPQPWPVTEGVAAQFPRINTYKLFETDRIVVWDQTWKPGDRITRHLHYHRTAAVFLEGGSIHSISDAGVASPAFTRKVGEVINTTTFNPAPHEEEGVEGTPRAIWVEFK